MMILPLVINPTLFTFKRLFKGINKPDPRIGDSIT